MSSRGAADGLRFTSCLGRSAATGFTSNRRPAVYHRPGSDRTDTPQLGLLLSDILVSQTERHFQPSGGPRRSGPLPSLTTPPRGSGSHQPRTPSRTGPSEDKSEYQSLFVPHRLTPSVGLDRGIVGKKGETGFTEGAELQLNTFQEKRIGSAEPRQTSSSVMRTDFPSPFPPQGTGAIPGLSALSCRETGFTRGASAPLSHPSSLLAPRRARSSAPAVKVIGKKELTGCVSNAPKNDLFPWAPFGSSHFTTHYRSTFCRYGNLNGPRSVPAAGVVSKKMDAGYGRRDAARLILKG